VNRGRDNLKEVSAPKQKVLRPSKTRPERKDRPHELRALGEGGHDLRVDRLTRGPSFELSPDARRGTIVSRETQAKALCYRDGEVASECSAIDCRNDRDSPLTVSQQNL